MTFRGRAFAMPADIYGDSWPFGTPTDDAGRPLDVPEYARYARHIAATLQGVIEGRQLSLRDVETLCGVDHGTVSKILKGRVLPDVATLSRLETGLGERLWPQ